MNNGLLLRPKKILFGTRGTMLRGFRILAPYIPPPPPPLPDTTMGNKYLFTMSSNSVQASGTAGLVSSVAASSDSGSTYEAWKAFDGVTGVNDNCWIPATNDSPAWLRVNFTTAQVVRRYDLWVAHATSWTPTAWTFEGSNNGSSWTTLDTRSGETGWSAYEMRSYSFLNANVYLHYRIRITAVTTTIYGNSYQYLGELELYD